MKHLHFFWLLFFATSIFSQHEIVLVEEYQSFLLGDKNSMTVNIPYGEPKTIEKVLKKEMKSWGGSFYINRGEYTVVQGKINDLGTGTINSYAKIRTGVGGEYLVTFTFDLGGVFLSSSEHAAQFKKMSEQIKEFALDASIKCLDSDISNKRETLSSTRKNLKLLEKEKEKLIQEINEYKTFILQAEKSLDNNIKNQTKTLESIQLLEIKITDTEKNKKKVKKN
jgi:hypothetical protein